MLIRLLTPLRVAYETAVKLADRSIESSIPSYRCVPDTVQLVRQAISEQRRAYVLINNRAEGCAPLTVQALVDQLAASALRR